MKIGKKDPKSGQNTGSRTAAIKSFGTGIVFARRAKSAAIRCGKTFAGFQKGFQAGEHARPAAVNAAGHRRTRLELVVRHGKAHRIFDDFNLIGDARHVFEILWIDPRHDEAFGRCAFQDFSSGINFRRFVVGGHVPGGTFLPIGDECEAAPILTGEFGFGDRGPYFLGRGADVGGVN